MCLEIRYTPPSCHHFTGKIGDETMDTGVSRFQANPFLKLSNSHRPNIQPGLPRLNTEGNLCHHPFGKDLFASHIYQSKTRQGNRSVTYQPKINQKCATPGCCTIFHSPLPQMKAEPVKISTSSPTQTQAKGEGTEKKSTQMPGKIRRLYAPRPQGHSEQWHDLSCYLAHPAKQVDYIWVCQKMTDQHTSTGLAPCSA